ncbi:trypsin-like peptidase domain-containing protein [Enterococcus sp. 669A]|uniref:Trypsin-like peptidase domain-containing protein n=1 Tax=Candidatus Enterococcus moelleringii TaxID=2815325 RepID=A0ABS3LG07_9ENTE|nr:trypsin-like peptidase domain-containing protein [Enterococcus sp. 669A]
MDIAEQLVSTTVKLSTDAGVGTGFFYKMDESSKGDFKPVIVTNRHVFEDANNVVIMLTLVDKNSNDIVKRYNIFNLKGSVIYHPDPEIDLAVLPCPGIFQSLMSQGYSFKSVFLEKKLIPTSEQAKDISAIEDVYIIGYPNGYMDEVNNRPLVRKGITASDYKLDYNGEPKFLVDSAIYGGSSGSPVIIYNRDGFLDKDGNYNLGQPRVHFLGINSAVMIQNLEGEISEEDVPTAVGLTSRLPIGLGVIIKSNQLEAFEEFLPE